MVKFAVRNYIIDKVRKFKPFSLTLKGELIEFNRPQVMGILNITPDSFYSKSRTTEISAIADRIRQMIENGADMIDIGAYSSRQGADDVSPAEECRRLESGMKILRDISSDIPVSVDTFRADVAREAVTNLGVNIINDISGGDLDNNMYKTVAEFNVPYIVMHMRGTPATMSGLTQYENVTADVVKDLSAKVNKLALAGVNDVIVDPGFGFSKTIGQNYELMKHLEVFHALERPLLVGISRKSMIYRPLCTDPENSLNGTTVLNTVSLLAGASILRVHDVKEAAEAVKITGLIYYPTSNQQ